MLSNYFKIALRIIIRQKANAAINILGLAFGISATILIFLYLQFEFSFDDFHQNADDIYRVSVVHKKEGQVEYDSHIFTPPIGAAMKKDFPEVEEFLRFSTLRNAYLYINNHHFKLYGIRHADSSLFDILSFKLIAGNPNNALVNPYSIVLSKTSANRIFASENPVGKMVKLDNKDVYQITGVIEDPPANSHIKFNALISFSTLYKDPHNYMDWNGGNQYITYIKVQENASTQAINNKFPSFMWHYINSRFADIGVSYEPYLQPLKRIHLYHNDYSSGLRTNLYLFSLIALLILFIACINFINLTTATSLSRAREVGTRKVFGANRTSVIKQFLTESILISFFALIVGVLLVELFLPIYRELVNTDIKLRLTDLAHIAGLLMLIFIVGIVAGGYPAFYLSKFQPIKTLKYAVKTRTGKPGARNLLVIFQFAISIILMICTIFIQKQLNFMQNKTLGFNKDNKLIIPLVNEEAKYKTDLVKKELLNLPNIISVSASSDVPYRGFTSNGYFPEGFQTPLMIHVVDVDEDFLKTYNIQLIKGRNFSKNFASDKNAYLINETLADFVQWEDPINKKINRNGDHEVIGVVKDFNYATLHSQIEPLIITNQPERNQFQMLSIVINPVKISETINSIENTWKIILADTPFEYFFLDEAFDTLYKREKKFRDIFFYFSCFAIIIALLGLFGLTSLYTVQRTKEVGIRKVLGASVVSISGLLSKEFLLLVIWANVVAWPITWVVVNKWLQYYAYKIAISYWVFILCGCFSLIIALVIISVQTIKTALANPIEALRYE